MGYTCQNFLKSVTTSFRQPLFLLPFQISDRKFGRPVVDEWSPDPGNPEAQGDIIDECLEYYKSNIFFPAYEIKNAADRLIIYGILYVTLALKT